MPPAAISPNAPVEFSLAEIHVVQEDVFSAPEKISVSPKPFVRSAPATVALFALRFYKAYLSMLFAGNCRFVPSCSLYAQEAIERFGVRRGSWLALKRLARCQPLSRKFGYDPIPEKWEHMPAEFIAVSAVSAAPATSTPGATLTRKISASIAAPRKVRS